MTLTDFLLARIAEDEPQRHDYWCSWNQVGETCDCRSRRVQAECEAKRRIVGLCGPIAGYGSTLPAVAMQCLLDLATVYADHPDYRDEWKP